VILTHGTGDHIPVIFTSDSQIVILSSFTRPHMESHVLLNLTYDIKSQNYEIWSKL